jgi:large subunit ribosomal protein L22
MQFVAKARYVWYSPYKLRPLADVIRGKGALYAVAWLTTYKTKRTVPFKKLIESAIANAYNLEKVQPGDLVVKELKVDQGPMHRYFKPAAMGRAMPQRKRLCHISVILEAKKDKERVQKWDKKRTR